MVSIQKPDKIATKDIDQTDIPTDTQVLTFNSSKNQWDSQDAGGGGGINTTSNTGTGDGWAKALVGDDAPFKSIITTSPLATTVNVDDLTITIDNILETILEVAVGASGTVLTSNGVGSAPTYQSGGAGDMILANVQTSTGKKTFAADATNAGFNLNNQVPSVTVAGDIWRTVDILTMRNNADTADLIFVVQGGALGTPSSGTLTSCTGLPIDAGTTGTLPVSRGGSGVTASTGSTTLVLADTPTLVTPILGIPTSGDLQNCTALPTTALTGILPDARMPNLTGDVTTVEGAVETTIPTNSVAETQCTVAVGAATTVLTSNGIGSAPTYAAPAGGEFTGAWSADHNQAGTGFSLRDARFSDVTDETKEVFMNVVGNGTGIVLTIAPTQSTNQTLSIPNITAADNVVTDNVAATLLSKTLTTPVIGDPSSITGVSGITGLGEQAQNMDYGGFDATDLGDVQFRSTVAPTAGIRGIAYEDATGFEFNALTTNVYNFAIAATDQMRLSATTLEIFGNALSFSADGHSITPTGTALTIDAGVSTDTVDLQTGGVSKLLVNGTTDVTLAVDLNLGANEINVTSGALGDILKHNATGFARFARGTTGQFFRATATDTAYQSIEISKGGTVLDPTGAINLLTWRAPFACTVTNVRGNRIGGTGATINARLNGVSNHLSSALSLTSTDTWQDGGSVQNTAYAAGDDLELMIVSITGSPTQIAIQVDYTRP